MNLHSVLIDNVAGGALTLQQDSLGSIDGSTIESNYDSNQCVPPAALNTGYITNLSVTNSTIASNSVGASRSTTGISALGNLDVGFSTVDGFNDNGIVSGPESEVAINASKIFNDGVTGLNTFSTPATGSFIPVTVTNSTIDQNVVGVLAQSVIMQGSTVTNNSQAGVGIEGPYADLGTFLSPGGNDFAGNSGTAVSGPEVGIAGVIDAIGDLWDAGVQGANASGFYPNPVTFTGADPEAMGQNFQLGDGFQGVNPRDSINLGPLTEQVGQLKLTPTTINTHAGKVTHLTLAWTSPVGWRQLQSIQLRLYRRATTVGSITIAPPNARLSATGALTLMTDRSRLGHAGKTVTANLRLRLPRALAGQTLRLAVQATDIHGHRQLEPDAGTIHVSR